MLLVSLLASFVLYDGQLSHMDGLFLLALALLWLLFTIKIARLAERQGSDSPIPGTDGRASTRRFASRGPALAGRSHDCDAYGNPNGRG